MRPRWNTSKPKTISTKLCCIENGISRRRRSNSQLGTESHFQTKVSFFKRGSNPAIHDRKVEDGQAAGGKAGQIAASHRLHVAELMPRALSS